MNYFYAEGIGNAEVIKLDERESHHAVHVLRLKPGDPIYLLDGIGNSYEAELVETGKKGASAKIHKRQHHPPNKSYHLHIAIAPTKSSDRFDFFLEKATEIGIDEITPLITQNSERRKFNSDKARQTLIAAIKQSGQLWLPRINDAVDISNFYTDQKQFQGQRIICHCQQGEKEFLHKSYALLNNVIVMVGPEGDFTTDEVNLALENKFIAVTMGETRLRTETAGIMICAMIKTINLIHQ